MASAARRSASQTSRRVPGTCRKTVRTPASRSRKVPPGAGRTGFGRGGVTAVRSLAEPRREVDATGASFLGRGVVDQRRHEHSRAAERRDHRDVAGGLVDRAGGAVLQRERLGRRLLLGEREGARGGPPHGPARSHHRPDGRGGGHPRAEDRVPLRGPVPGRPPRPGEADQRGLREGRGGDGVRRPLLRRLSDQGEPDARGGRGDPRRRRALPLRAGGGVQGRAAGGARDEQRPRGAHHLQRVQGRGVPAPGPARPQARPQGDRGDREALRAAAPLAARRGDGRRADDRPALEAHHARHRQVGGLVRRLRQVRADRPRAHPRGAHPEGRGQGALRAAPPLPRRLAAHRDPGGQGRRQRGGPRLRQAPQDGAAHRVLRRGRRARGGLRRHALERLRLVGQLQHGRVRGRPRLQRPARLRERGRARAAHRLGVGPRRLGPPLLHHHERLRPDRDRVGRGDRRRLGAAGERAQGRARDARDRGVA